jgi:hypothetical protein
MTTYLLVVWRSRMSRAIPLLQLGACYRANFIIIIIIIIIMLIGPVSMFLYVLPDEDQVGVETCYFILKTEEMFPSKLVVFDCYLV